MPELPEVEVVRRGLEAHVVGRRIAEVETRGERVARRHVPGPADLADRLRGLTVREARRRGKYLWLVLDGDLALVVHLGMSGQLLVERRRRHGRATPAGAVGFADGGPELRFVDQRTFGGVLLADLGPDGIPAPVTHIARDLLDPELDQPAVVRRIHDRSSAVKRVLLDQQVVSGIGNIYADEALWRAGIHGERLGRGPDQADDLPPARPRPRRHGRRPRPGWHELRRLYVNVNGASGYFDRSLQAYGQEGRPCSRCGTPIRSEQFMNRSSFFCPRCQPGRAPPPGDPPAYDGGGRRTARITVFVRGMSRGWGSAGGRGRGRCELGLVGHARNTDDGRVEIVVEGRRRGDRLSAARGVPEPAPAGPARSTGCPAPVLSGRRGGHRFRRALSPQAVDPSPRDGAVPTGHRA